MRTFLYVCVAALVAAVATVVIGVLAKLMVGVTTGFMWCLTILIFVFLVLWIAGAGRRHNGNEASFLDVVLGVLLFIVWVLVFIWSRLLG